MYLSSVFVLLLVVQHNTEANIIKEQLEECDGGYCMPKHLCPTGRDKEVLTLGRNYTITLKLGARNECGDVMKICCKDSNINSTTANSEVPKTDQKCGISNPGGLVYNIDSNNTFAQYAEFPWTVAIFEMFFAWENLELTYIGAGALIHPKFVLTAAHILKDSHRYVARFGEWNIRSEAEIYPAQDIEIEEHISHPEHIDTVTLGNDLALAVLKENVIYTEHIRPLCLPSSQDEFFGQHCILTGWRLDLRKGGPASLLKSLKMSVLSHLFCEGFYMWYGISFWQSRGVMCAATKEHYSRCIKDAGTPLACQKDDGSYVLAGITSRTEDCSRPDGITTVYVNVAMSASWIHNTIEEYEKWYDEGYNIV